MADEPLLSADDVEELDDVELEELPEGDELSAETLLGLNKHLAGNDEWAYKQADRMVAKLPQQHGKDRRTEGEVFDHQTLMTLHRLLSHGVLQSLDFPISTGKEANVFRGTTPAGGFVAVKIYRVNTATFKHVLQYIQGDERFKGVAGDKKTLVYAWAQKEFRNLHRMRDAGVDVPEPIKVLNNVLVTEYLGVEEGPWPKLQKMGRLPNPRAFFEKLASDYALIFNKAGLIHGDLSPFNILVERADEIHEGNANPRIIDVGHAVLRNHPHGELFLARDIENLTDAFRRQGLRDLTANAIRSRLE